MCVYSREHNFDILGAWPAIPLYHCRIEPRFCNFLSLVFYLLSLSLSLYIYIYIYIYIHLVCTYVYCLTISFSISLVNIPTKKRPEKHKWKAAREKIIQKKKQRKKIR